MRTTLDALTQGVAIVGFCGLVVMAMLTMADALLRWSGLPRIPGFGDYGDVVFALVIASCFPAGLIRGHNITIRFLGRALGERRAAWPELFGSVVTLVFFSLLVWQFVVYTLDLGANQRTTRTLELPLAPWWWATTLVMALTIPVQLLVVIDNAIAAVTGRPVRVQEQLTAEVNSSDREATHWNP